MPITDQDNVNHREAARILGISLVAVMRGELTTAQKRRIDQILAKAKKREDAKRTTNGA